MELDIMYKKCLGRSTLVKKSNETMRILVIIFAGITFGFFIGVLFPALPFTKLNIVSTFQHDIGNKTTGNATENRRTSSNKNETIKDLSKIWVTSNPKGAERLPPGIVVSGSDFYPRRLWGKPSESGYINNHSSCILDYARDEKYKTDLVKKPKYLATFTVGYDQRNNIDKAVKKFSENFTILLFHYDGKTTEWDSFEWSQRAIHVSARKQTKWWFAKRFLHPDIVEAYDYIFIWDEDLGVDHFNAEEYIRLVKKHGLEISQPGLEPKRKPTWQMTKRRVDHEVHKEAEVKPSWCRSPHSPPCAAFVEIMAPVFSRDAWRCVWHMIQNDLVHGWGLDFNLQRCVQPAHEKIGVVDTQWIVHQTIPSLGNQGQAEEGKAPWQGVRQRCKQEWKMFTTRLDNAEKSYYKSIGIDPSNFTAQT